MKTRFYILVFPIILLCCKKDEPAKIFIPRIITANEDFNSYQKNKENAITIHKYVNSDHADNELESDEWMIVRIGDTTVRIQTNPSDKSAVTEKFSFAQFINTQKTCLLVQIADNSGLVAPFYLIALKNDKFEVISLYRPSKGSNDVKFTKGLSKIGNSRFLVNNDFLITNVNSKVYFIKRQNSEERIQGLHFVNSPDKDTLVFLMPSSFYEVHYLTDEVFIQPLPSIAPEKPADLYKWVQNNYSWQKDAKGISFLKANVDDDRVIDISEFKGT